MLNFKTLLTELKIVVGMHMLLKKKTWSGRPTFFTFNEFRQLQLPPCCFPFLECLAFCPVWDEHKFYFQFNNGLKANKIILTPSNFLSLKKKTQVMYAVGFLI